MSKKRIVSTLYVPDKEYEKELLSKAKQPSAETVYVAEVEKNNIKEDKDRD